MPSSPLYPGELIYDDDNPIENLQMPTGLAAGRLERDIPFGDIFGASPFPAELLIPEHEWQARIQEMEERKSRISDIIVMAGLKVKLQTVNFCWSECAVETLEILQAVANLPHRTLSAASVACRVNGFVNQGGYVERAIAHLAQYGANTEEDWPQNAINRRYDTPETRERALENRMAEWFDLRPRNKQEMVSALLRRMPGANGRNRISHAMTSCDAVWLDGEVAIRERNSHGNRSDQPNGFLIIRGSNMLCDSIQCPRAAA